MNQILNRKKSTPLNLLNITGKKIQFSKELKAGTNRLS